MPWGIAAAALGIGGSLIGGAANANAATQAAKIQAQAANRATDLQQNIFNQTQTQLAPYYDLGTAALSALQTGVGSYQGQLVPNAPFLQSGTTAPGGSGPYPTYPTFPSLPAYNPTGFQQSPGYQWQLGQGIQAAEDLGSRSQGTVGGNTLKALQTYGTGLANQDYYNWLQNIYNPTYQSQLQNTLLPYQANVGQYGAGVNQWLNQLNAYNTAQGNAYNRLAALVSGGQGAAAQQGTFGQNFGAQAGQNIIGAGNAGAAGTVGATNALTGGINSALTNLLSPNAGSNSVLGNALSSLFGGGNIANNNALAYNINAAPAQGPYATQTTSPSYGVGF